MQTVASLDTPIAFLSSTMRAVLARSGAALSLIAQSLISVLVTATPSHAQFFVCNQTFDVSNVAIGYYKDTDFQTSGWWTIGPNQCANVIDDPLTSRFIYVYAHDVFGKTILSGAAPMCVDAKRFSISGTEDCLVRGYIEARFHKVDTRQSERWTLFLYPPAE